MEGRKRVEDAQPRGIYVEAFKDVTFRIEPIREAAAGKMVRELRSSSVLEGLRGEPPSDMPAIEDALKRLSQLANDFPQIAELDINPLIVHPVGEGCHVADIRIRLERDGAEQNRTELTESRRQKQYPALVPRCLVASLPLAAAEGRAKPLW